ncbi:hypothetical protein CEXT_761941 [Caerostris extrusa]|uniref:Uncharacterized protein n=1 Tax=Caerostris extrusa TaxID=172846 RepID=A0AAV4N8N7_CAEEX|nr:hypothetical protein CEXT_761941 [Caerostris extrusa]
MEIPSLTMLFHSDKVQELVIPRKTKDMMIRIFKVERYHSFAFYLGARLAILELGTIRHISLSKFYDFCSNSFDISLSLPSVDLEKNFKEIVIGVKEKSVTIRIGIIGQILFVLVALKHAKIVSSQSDSQTNISVPTTIQQAIAGNAIVIFRFYSYLTIHNSIHLLLAHLISKNIEQYFHFEERHSITKEILNIEFFNKNQYQ